MPNKKIGNKGIGNKKIGNKKIGNKRTKPSLIRLVSECGSNPHASPNKNGWK